MYIFGRYKLAGRALASFLNHSRGSSGANRLLRSVEGNRTKSALYMRAENVLLILKKVPSPLPHEVSRADETSGVYLELARRVFSAFPGLKSVLASTIAVAGMDKRELLVNSADSR